MGKLQHIESGAIYALSSLTIVGRARRKSDLLLSDPRVSSVHAEIMWMGNNWAIRDLGSTNGTYVEHRRLEDRETRVLMRDDRVAFGRADDLYRLLSNEPPVASATSDDGQRLEAELGILLLPAPTGDAWMVYRDGGEWCLEPSDGSTYARRRTESGEMVPIGDRVWMLDLPDVPKRTAGVDEQPSLRHDIKLRFLVSLGEEDVALEIVDLKKRTRPLRLPVRAHWKTLLVLAERRLKERGDGVSDHEAGWMLVEDLMEASQNIVESAMSEDLLNQHVRRARNHFRAADIADYREVIERRPNTRTIRIGVGQLEIVQP